MNTKHANERQKQRGITPLMLQALMIYGDEVHQCDGATRLIVTQKGYQKIMKDLKAMVSKAEKLKDLFAVEAGNQILTVGYRNKNIYRK